MAEHRFHTRSASVPVPVGTLWALLVRAQARGLWQPGVISAELLIGTEGCVHSEFALNCQSPLTPALVIERIVNAAPAKHLQTLKHYPGIDCLSSYNLQPVSAQQSRVAIQRLLKSPQEMEQHAALSALLDPQYELAGLKRVSADLIKHL